MADRIAESVGVPREDIVEDFLSAGLLIPPLRPETDADRKERTIEWVVEVTGGRIYGYGAEPAEFEPGYIKESARPITRAMCDEEIAKRPPAINMFGNVRASGGWERSYRAAEVHAWAVGHVVAALAEASSEDARQFEAEHRGIPEDDEHVIRAAFALGQK